MKILLDENMPHSVLGFLKKEGHHVDTVNTLRLKGLDNGTLYREVAQQYNLFFTRDVGFIGAVRRMKEPNRCVTLRLVLPQLPKEKFLPIFQKAFQTTDWKQYRNGDDWPTSLPPPTL